VICEQVRLHIGADPRATERELEQHLETCPACSKFRAEMRSLDADIHRALERPPDARRARTPRRAIVWREWALAASLLLATLAVLGVWLLRPSDTLAREVVAHVQEEPESWLTTQHVTAESIQHALRGADATLDITSDKISYAQSCWLLGHYVPHFVVQTTRGPVTVIILRHETVPARRAFHVAGMSGVLLPATYGSIAVLARGGAAGVDEIADEMKRHVRSVPESN